MRNRTFYHQQCFLPRHRRHWYVEHHIFRRLWFFSERVFTKLIFFATRKKTITSKKSSVWSFLLHRETLMTSQIASFGKDRRNYAKVGFQYIFFFSVRKCERINYSRYSEKKFGKKNQFSFSLLSRAYNFRVNILRRSPVLGKTRNKYLLGNQWANGWPS